MPAITALDLGDDRKRTGSGEGGGAQCPLRDPSSELQNRGNWRSRAKIIHGMGGGKEEDDKLTNTALIPFGVWRSSVDMSLRTSM